MIITATIDRKHYLTSLQTPTNTIYADEPETNGGQDKGFAPQQLLAASLASCTAITLRMYSDRKEWNIDEIIVKIELTRNLENKSTNFDRKIILPLGTSDEIKSKLLEIADRCPVHQILTNPIQIQTKAL
jgi:putative redox protein